MNEFEGDQWGHRNTQSGEKGRVDTQIRFKTIIVLRHQICNIILEGLFCPLKIQVIHQRENAKMFR